MKPHHVEMLLSFSNLPVRAVLSETYKNKSLVHYKERFSLELYFTPFSCHLLRSPSFTYRSADDKVRSIHRIVVERRRAPAKSRNSKALARRKGDERRKQSSKVTVAVDSTVLTVLQQDVEDEHEVFHGTDRHLPRSRGLWYNIQTRGQEKRSTHSIPAAALRIAKCKVIGGYIRPRGNLESKDGVALFSFLHVWSGRRFFPVYARRDASRRISSRYWRVHDHWQMWQDARMLFGDVLASLFFQIFLSNFIYYY